MYTLDLKPRHGVFSGCDLQHRNERLRSEAAIDNGGWSSLRRLGSRAEHICFGFRGSGVDS